MPNHIVGKGIRSGYAVDLVVMTREMLSSQTRVFYELRT